MPLQHSSRLGLRGGLRPPVRSLPKVQRVCLSLCIPLAFLAACGEATAPAGKSAEVRLRAYIDLDASGSFTSGDAPISGAKLTVASNDASGTPAVEATTGADGFATLTLKPGSYTISPPAAGPAGTVLTTSGAPRVVVSALGTYSGGELRYAYLPATISGRIFRDDNANGTYDGTDTPGAGLAVVLRREQAGAPGARVDSTVTDAAGAYTFRFLTPGVYYASLENPSSISYGTSGAVRRVEIGAGAALQTNAIFTGALITDIATARLRANGQTVAVQGSITVLPGSFVSGTGGVSSEVWVQDATGGIAVFPVPTSDAGLYALGDRVEAQGVLSVFSGQRQVGGPTLRFTRLGAGTPVTPVAQTVAQALTLANEGRLVTLSGLRITEVQPGTGALFNVTAVDAAGAAITIRAVASGLTRAAFVVGDRYAITGVLSQFNGTAQVKPRGVADVAPAVATVASARAAAAGTVITVGGNITVPPNVFTSGTGGALSEIWVQDATGGIAAFSVPSTESANFALGDRVELTGARGANAGQLQLGMPSLVKVATGSAPAPVILTGTAANALTNDGQLVTVAALTVTTVGTGTGAAFNVTGTAADGATVTVRIAAANTGLTRANFTVGQTYGITGVLTQFNGMAQLKPRFRTDVTP
ncbi:MAG: SdrD B-like domain-containing protein [Gemmatimonadota bacterium]